MKVPLFILGFLIKFGSLCGYDIKKIIESEVSDFAQIKLPNIYYHLEKMENERFIKGENGENEKGLEKRIFKITDKGMERFNKLLYDTLDAGYFNESELDFALYFFNALDKDVSLGKLIQYRNVLEKKIDMLEKHKKETLNKLGKKDAKYANLIFEHHKMHLKAELEWTNIMVTTIQKEE